METITTLERSSAGGCTMLGSGSQGLPSAEIEMWRAILSASAS